MNYLDRKFGTGWPKYGAMLAISIVGVGLSFWNHFVGIGWFVFFIFIFWSQRNTK